MSPNFEHLVRIFLDTVETCGYDVSQTSSLIGSTVNQIVHSFKTKKMMGIRRYIFFASWPPFTALLEISSSLDDERASSYRRRRRGCFDPLASNESNFVATAVSIHPSIDRKT
jgi:hypothetical protein